jgi:hypothetical protein
MLLTPLWHDERCGYRPWQCGALCPTHTHLSAFQGTAPSPSHPAAPLPAPHAPPCTLHCPALHPPLPHHSPFTSQVLHSGVGPLTLTDVNLASAAGAHLVTFNLGASGTGGMGDAALRKAVEGAGLAGVRLLSHSVIYHLLDELRGVVEGEWGRARLRCCCCCWRCSTCQAAKWLPAAS